MKKIKLITTASLAAFVLAVTSCDRVDYGDLNSQQIQPEQGNAESLLRGSMARYFTIGGRDYLGNATNYVQYQTQITYTSESRYADTEGQWDQYYAVILPGLKEAATTTSSPKGTTENLNATAKLFSVMVWKRVTDTFGDVPYSQALLGLNNLTPAYDKQEDIYKDLIEQCKDARDMFSTAPTAFRLDANTDVVYKGDINKWKRFANSYIMHLALQLSKKYPSAAGYASVEFNAALGDSAGIIASNADNMYFTPDNVGGVRNPFSGLRSSDYCASREFTDALKGSGTSYNPTSNHTVDNRNRLYLTSATANGYPYGNAETPTISSAIGNKGQRLNLTQVRAATAVRPVFCASYSLLDRAEAADLGWTSESATTLLNNAIIASYAQWNAQAITSATLAGVAAPAAITGDAAYAAARVADATTFGIQRVIAEEKWVAMFPNAFDAWANYRRTGFPALVPAVDALNGGVIPERVRYPQKENTLNNASLNAGVSNLFPATDHNTSKMWWNQ